MEAGLPGLHSQDYLPPTTKNTRSPEQVPGNQVQDMAQTPTLNKTTEPFYTAQPPLSEKEGGKRDSQGLWAPDCYEDWLPLLLGLTPLREAVAAPAENNSALSTSLPPGQSHLERCSTEKRGEKAPAHGP